MEDSKSEAACSAVLSTAGLCGTSVSEALMQHGVFKGMHGLEGLLNANEFWESQPYGTRLYYGDGIADYLHRSALRAAADALTHNAQGKQPATTNRTRDKT